MVTSRDLVRATLALFLPAVVVLVVIVPIVEPIIRGHEVLASPRHISLSLAVAEPLLIAAGYMTGLSLLRSRLNPGAFRRRWLHLTSGLVSVAVLGITSIFSQGAHLPWIISASAGAGLLTAFLFFGFRAGHRVAIASN
jgi:hypothetical protein